MIREYLKEHILITDGAMGTYYDRKNQKMVGLRRKRICWSRN